ncbi:MAG TPA: universal stress protein [Reyranella sp.]|jgi:nucleotide-binding universal stress UspA family protein|nr:universal stress protein [Reyranella sp.]
MAYKTILVHCDVSRGTAGRLRIAADLADRFGGHVIGLYVRRAFQAPAFTDAGPAMDSLYRTYETTVRAEEAMATAAFRDAVGNQGLSSEWRVADGYVDEILAAEARVADLVIVGQAEPDSPPTTTPADLAEGIAMAAECPVLIVPYIGAAKPPGKTVMLCWNDSREAKHAATAALPLLAAADKVIVLIIDPKADRNREEPGADVAVWLARHGVKVTVQRDSAADSDVGGVILSRAADHDIDLIVMGIYGHSRMRERVLGGASRTLLASMTAPLLVAH